MSQENTRPIHGTDIVTDIVIDKDLYKPEIEIEDVEEALMAVSSLVESGERRSLTFYFVSEEFESQTNSAPELELFQRKNKDDKEFEDILSAVYRYGDVGWSIHDVSRLTYSEDSITIHKKIDEDNQIELTVNRNGEFFTSRNRQIDQLK